MAIDISDVLRRVVYAPNGTGPYQFTFEVLAQTDIAVYRGSTLLTLTTDYTVSLNVDGTGSVTLVSTAGTSNITIVGDRGIARSTDFVTGGDLLANSLNDELDAQTIFNQQTYELALRGLKAPVYDPTDINMTLPAKASRLGKVLSFDATTGDPVASITANEVANAQTYATNAAASASTASTAATNAGNSATAAATSATNASNSATSASTSATNAANSATSASNSASTATTQASNASTSATNAANSATAAASSASTATTQAGIATTQASNAATSASNAASSASSAASSASDAAASAAAAATALDNFDDRYLGAKSANPTLDNDGNALLTGALYYRTTTPIGMKVYDGSQWLEASAAQQSLMVTYEYVATSGQTTFSGADANGATLSYVANSILVSLNGVVLRPGDDYTATNGTSIVLTSAAALNDELIVQAFAVFNVANAVAKTGDTMTGSLLLPDGSASTVALGNDGDANTGIFFPAADTVAVATGGSERVRVDSSGNVGIGTSSPNFSGYGTTNLTVSGGTTIQGVLELVGTRADVSGGAVGNINFFANSNSAGNKQIAAIQALTDGSTANNRGGAVTLLTKADNGSLLERMRIDSSGNWLVGGASMVSSGRALIQWNSANSIEGLILYDTDSTAVGRFAQKFNRNGTVVGSIQTTLTATSYVTSSDYRLKENVQPMTGALAKVAALKPVTYTWKADGSAGEGFIAHELAEVVPDAVTGEKDAVNEDGSIKPQGIDTSFLVATLTAALQEAHGLIKDLQARVDALEAK